jgi:PAS domain S-box-containing protein
VRQELIEHLDGSYRFIHDRVQEAAYSQIPQASREADHLRIGQLLVAHTPPAQLDEAIFEIVSQLNRGATLITARDEREQLAELNLIAGRRAKASSAYASALSYLVAGTALLAEGAWERRYDLILALELGRAECEFLTGALAEAEQRFTVLSTCAANTIDRVAVASLRVDLYTTLAQSSRAIAVGLDCLRHLGIDWSPHPSEEEARREYDRIWSQLGSRPIESLIDLPLMSDPASLATMDVLTKLGIPALYADANLLLLVTCRRVNLSLERGNCDASCIAYVRLGMLAGARFGDYQVGFRFGQLGYDLVEERGLARFRARTYMVFGNALLPWTKHVRAARDLLRRSFEVANTTGELIIAAYCGNQLNTSLLMAGDPLAEAEREAERGLAFAQRAGFGFVIDRIATQLGLIRTLRGLTPAFGCLNNAQFDESRIERRFSENPDLAFVEFWYWVRKLQARFFAGDHAAAVEASSRARRLLRTSDWQLERAEYRFYSALSQAASCDSATVDERRQHLDAIAAHHRQLQLWAAVCPENFEDRVALVGAEIARLEGRDREAMDLYERAIRSAQANGFVHNEALANELTSRFYAARGFEKIARVYLQDARYGYLRWGATGKVRQLDQLYPQLREAGPFSRPTGTIETPVEHLDLTTMIKVSQAVSSEIVLERLLDTLMCTAIEQAGAQRGLLIVPRGEEQRIAAEATTPGDTVKVLLREEPVTAAALPESILHYVLRTRQAVLLDDAAAENPFAADPYLHLHQARSILCLPLINQSKLIGVLYLENNLAPHVFTPARLAVLKLLASQAAISLENTRLYRDVVEREAKIRRLVDANIIGIFIWESEGQIFEANDAFLHMVGQDRRDLVAGRLRWTDLTPAEWRKRHEQFWTPQLRTTGSVQPYEKEYFRKDGSRLPVLVGAASFDATGNQGVSFVLDLTERKRAEAEARESEGRYRRVQMELAHANRLATMGQLSVSIAHEVKQPIAATAINAAAALRWLGGRPANLEKAREALGRIVEISHRAGDVVDRIRALINKAPPRNDRLDINEAIREVIELTHGEAVRTGVSMQTLLADGLPHIHGDRVQLQQVILNLIMNALEAMSGIAEAPRELLITTGLAEPSGVLVSVRDSGPGLAPATLERLFEAFYTTKPNGLGMGLSICRSIIEAHGGRLWAEANEPRGAVFQFLMPAQP